MDFSTARTSLTNLANPWGSTEAAWSLPHIALSSVICRSTMQAPKATAAMAGDTNVTVGVEGGKDKEADGGSRTNRLIANYQAAGGRLD